VSADRPEDRTAVDVEHLDRSALISCDAQLAVGPDLATCRRLLEARDGLDDAVRLGRVDLEASARGDDVAVRRRRREVHMCHWSIRLEERRGLLTADR